MQISFGKKFTRNPEKLKDRRGTGSNFLFLAMFKV